MARRRWVERDHPRHPAGDKGGQFRDRVGSGGWAAKVASAIGTRRSRGSRITTSGDKADLPPWKGGAQDDDDVYRREWGSEVRSAIREAGFDPDEVEQAWGGDFEEDYPDYQTIPHDFAESAMDQFMHPETDDGRGDDKFRRDLAAEMDAEFSGENELAAGFARDDEQISREEVAKALSARGERANPKQVKYAQTILDEANAVEGVNRDDGESDQELVAQMNIVREAIASGDADRIESAVAHLRQMLTISYLDDDELPKPVNAPVRRNQSGRRAFE